MQNVSKIYLIKKGGKNEACGCGIKKFICAAEYAKKKGITLTEFLPEYEKYGKRAPLIRNLEIIDYADEVIAFWDGESHGTKYVIDNCRNRIKKIKIYVAKK